MPLSRQLESFFSRRYDSRPALYVPSGRLGLYLALRHQLKRGSRVLMSPVTCDQVLLVTLAAGMIPVFGPVMAATGNLDPHLISAEQWRSLGAVITTSLYGVPDDLVYLSQKCEEHQVQIIEDACHALDSSLGGRRVGLFGHCAVLSLAKHFLGSGAILLFRDETDRRELVELLRGTLDSTLGVKARVAIRQVWQRLWPGVKKAAAPMIGHRQGLDRTALEVSMQGVPQIQAFDRFLTYDGPIYRCMPGAAEQARTLKLLASLDDQHEPRLKGTLTLINEGLVDPAMALPTDCGLLRVPVFVEQREAAITALAGHRVFVTPVYDPPLNEFAPWMENWSGTWSPLQHRWSRSVLPVNPAAASQIVQAWRALPPNLRAAPLH